MAYKELSVARFKEIERMLALGISARQISKALQCSRNTVGKIAAGEIVNPEDKVQCLRGPLWAEMQDWNEIYRLYKEGHPIKYIWEEKAGQSVSYVNFWKFLCKKFPEIKMGTYVRREFAPGDRCEVDYAGQKLEWIDRRTGEIHDAVVFIGVLGHSQYMFAYATVNAKSKYFLESHRRMYEHFGGVPAVTVPDCLKQGVSRCHLYDPDINPSYTELAQHYHTAVVPARPRHPKDKAIVEGAVTLSLRYFRWLYRDHTFYSIDELNAALAKVVEVINHKIHSRFKTSRHALWESTEKATLRELPETPYEYIEWLTARVHPDCHVATDGNYYSVPHMHRGKEVKIRISSKQVEIYYQNERLAVHGRVGPKSNRFTTVFEHLPENAKAYRETIPSHLLSQAKFLHVDLHELIKEMFEADTLGNLRRAQGLIRSAKKEIMKNGHAKAAQAISMACHAMKHVNKIRVPFFQELLKEYSKIKYQQEDRDIQRDHNNPMLRHTGNQSLKTKGGD
jgi:hypothetical protein